MTLAMIPVPPVERRYQSDLVVIQASSDRAWLKWLTSWMASPVLNVHPVAVDGQSLPKRAFWKKMATRPYHTRVLLFVSPSLEALYETPAWKQLWERDSRPSHGLTILTRLPGQLALPLPQSDLLPPVSLSLGKGEQADRLALYDCLTGVPPLAPSAPYPVVAEQQGVEEADEHQPECLGVEGDSPSV